MKLLLVTWNFPDTVMRPFDMYYFYWPAREALKRGWEVEVLTFQVSPLQPVEELIDEIKVFRCPAKGRKGRPFSWPFIHKLLTTDANLIHCHGYGEGTSELTILIGKLRNLPVVFSPHFHRYPYTRPIRELYDRTIGRFFFNRCSRVIVFTNYTFQQLLRVGVTPARLQVVPHVARPEVFADLSGEPERGSLLRQAKITGSPLILGVGQLIERKGWEYTLLCLPAIIERFPEALLLIIGPSQPADPIFRRRLILLALQLGILDHLQIAQDNSPEFIRDAYRTATIVTHPSFVESFGVVTLEAMTAGVPIVAHNGTGIPCVLSDGEVGYTLDVRDTARYTQALLQLLKNPDLRRNMGAEGQRQAVERFGLQAVAPRLFAVYAEVTRNASLPNVTPQHATTSVNHILQEQQK